MNKKIYDLVISTFESLKDLCDNNNDLIFIESVISGFKAMFEGDIEIEFLPVHGKIIHPDIYIPTSHTAGVVREKGKMKYVEPNLKKEDVLQDVIMWFYTMLNHPEKLYDDIMKFILFTPNPEVIARSINNIPFQEPIKINLKEHPLWERIKEQAIHLLETEPKLSKMKERIYAKVSNDMKSYSKLKKSNLISLQNIEKINEIQDTYKSFKNIGNIPNKVSEKEKKEQELKGKRQEEILEKTKEKIKEEEQRKEKLKNMALKDLIKDKSDEKATLPSLDDLIKKDLLKQAEKSEKFAKLAELFK